MGHVDCDALAKDDARAVRTTLRDETGGGSDVEPERQHGWKLIFASNLWDKSRTDENRTGDTDGTEEDGGWKT